MKMGLVQSIPVALVRFEMHKCGKKEKSKWKSLFNVLWTFIEFKYFFDFYVSHPL